MYVITLIYTFAYLYKEIIGGFWVGSRFEVLCLSWEWLDKSQWLQFNTARFQIADGLDHLSWVFQQCVYPKNPWTSKKEGFGCVFCRVLGSPVPTRHLRSHDSLGAISVCEFYFSHWYFLFKNHGFGAVHWDCVFVRGTVDGRNPAPPGIAGFLPSIVFFGLMLHWFPLRTSDRAWILWWVQQEHSQSHPQHV